jgi:hypothetical protein
MDSEPARQVDPVSAFRTQWQREKRVAFWAVGAILFLCVAVMGAALIPPRRGDLEVRRLLLRDDAGIVRVQLTLDGDGQPRMAFYDPLGREQFTLRGLPDNSASMRFSQNGLLRAQLQTPARGLADWRFYQQTEGLAARAMRDGGIEDPAELVLRTRSGLRTDLRPEYPEHPVGASRPEFRNVLGSPELAPGSPRAPELRGAGRPA